MTYMSEPATSDGPQVPTWTLGWRLKRSLDFADVSAQEMAEELGVHPGTVSRWMNDRERPRIIYLRAWAYRCKVPIDWLVEGDGFTSEGEHVDSHHDSIRTASEAQLRGGEPQLRGRHPNGKREITEWSKKIDPDWNSQLHRAIPTEPRPRSLEAAA